MTASAFAANGAVITLTQKWPNQLAKNSGSRDSRLSKPVSRNAVTTRTISSAQRMVQHEQRAPEEPDVEPACLVEDPGDRHVERARNSSSRSRANTSGSDPAVAFHAPGEL